MYLHEKRKKKKKEKLFQNCLFVCFSLFFIECCDCDQIFSKHVFDRNQLVIIKVELCVE